MFFKNMMMASVAMSGAGLIIFSSAMAIANEAKAKPLAGYKDNNAQIRITGSVGEVMEDSFRLKYGGDTVIVEVDDWDWYDEAAGLKEGEKVTVFGDIDHDFFEVRSIEAESVYAHERNTYFFADDADEEDYSVSYTYMPAKLNFDNVEDGTWYGVRGTVDNVSGREFTIRTTMGDVIVDTDQMGYNPMDDEGHQKVEQGDRVYVSGNLDKDFFEANEIKADQILTLHKHMGANPS